MKVQKTVNLKGIIHITTTQIKKKDPVNILEALRVVQLLDCLHFVFLWRQSLS